MTKGEKMLVCVKGFEEISSDELVKINGGSAGLEVILEL